MECWLVCAEAGQGDEDEQSNTEAVPRGAGVFVLGRVMLADSFYFCQFPLQAVVVW
jgi:hypothetical protein